MFRDSPDADKKIPARPGLPKGGVPAIRNG
jgi:hypothetical protein